MTETMPDVPKIVPERLKAGARVAAHPDLDVLTAFVEQVLPAAERESVLEHLEKCGDCREVLAVSLPPLSRKARFGDTASQCRRARGRCG